MTGTIRLTAKGAAWIASGHLWVYKDDIAAGGKQALDGEIVEVTGPGDKRLGHAFFSFKSGIALRILGGCPNPPNETFFRDAIASAIKRRGDAFNPETACRLVSSEGDLLPGLIVDHYAGHLSIQLLVPGVEKMKDALVAALKDIVSPKSITFRCDASARKLEGLPSYKETVFGQVPPFVNVREGVVFYGVDIMEGQKTGGYLDQSANRVAMAGYAKGRGMDAFTYNGLFAMHMAKKCSEVVAMDSSGPAIERVKANCELNSIENVRAVKANVFDELEAMHKSGERFDTIVLDPPPFAKSRKDVASAERGYRELNRRAFAMLEPGGILATYSCSYNVSTADFLAILRKAAGDAKRHARVLAQQTQPLDHPILLGMPETQYLKGFVVQAAD